MKEKEIKKERGWQELGENRGRKKKWTRKRRGVAERREMLLRGCWSGTSNAWWCRIRGVTATRWWTWAASPQQSQCGCAAVTQLARHWQDNGWRRTEGDRERWTLRSNRPRTKWERFWARAFCCSFFVVSPLLLLQSSRWRCCTGPDREMLWSYGFLLLLYFYPKLSEGITYIS